MEKFVKKGDVFGLFGAKQRKSRANGHTNEGAMRVYKWVKRAADIVVSLILLLILIPFVPLIAWFIRRDSPGCVIFTQPRIGRDGRAFMIYKFRTMRLDAPHNVSAEQREKTAPFITPSGRFLRRSSLDELPQLLNVLKGDMSIVGPRPVVRSERELLRLRRQSGAERVRPGITGLAQVSGRDVLTATEKAYYDGVYAEQLSFWMDLRILLLTFRCFFRGG